MPTAAAAVAVAVVTDVVVIAAVVIVVAEVVAVEAVTAALLLSGLGLLWWSPQVWQEVGPLQLWVFLRNQIKVYYEVWY